MCSGFRRFPFAAGFVRQFHVQALHPVAQRMAGEFEGFGGARQAKIVLGERAVDEFAFQPGKGVVERFVGRGLDGRGLLQARLDLKIRQAGRLDFMGRLQNQGTFDVSSVHFGWTDCNLDVGG